MTRNASEIDQVLAEFATLRDHVAKLAKAHISDAAETAGTAARNGGSATMDGAGEMLTSCRDAIRDSPMTSLAGAFVLGLALARLLKR